MADYVAAVFVLLLINLALAGVLSHVYFLRCRQRRPDRTEQQWRRLQIWDVGLGLVCAAVDCGFFDLLVPVGRFERFGGQHFRCGCCAHHCQRQCVFVDRQFGLVVRRLVEFVADGQ